MSTNRTVPVVIVNYDADFPWRVFALRALLLLLDFVFRRTRWAAYAFLILGMACMGVAALLWAVQA
ncbi:hypothetical protein EHF33_15335 [Deinococcus psychrotolerans]|uniref:Uncharacterized protein n=1 Tax=Deinococcus psychrotolerans TaxID=2489213 RepID=A0A3G8YG38_9DEIO|nr:hypothetical protein [Deinococcus psychrotolerans]AZI44262.1 hypothetical protein EHF33_15335 [Deinococcus psychrotolerans]